MSIDRIGKGGAPPVVPDAGTVEGSKGVEKAFSVERPAAAQATEAAGPVDASSPLARLRAGEIDVNGYADLKVEEATKGLKGLSASELGDIRSLLKEQLVSDPGLVDLVRTATGKVPSAAED